MVIFHISYYCIALDDQYKSRFPDIISYSSVYTGMSGVTRTSALSETTPDLKAGAMASKAFEIYNSSR